MKYLLILGNGFSIDLLKYLNKNDSIPLTNLVAEGDKLHWPADNGGAFLSFRNTPNLWILGIRPSNPSERNNQIIENIITCANAYYLKAPSSRSFGTTDKRSIYIDAYRELVVYLKYLFVHFDKTIDIKLEDLKDWPWARLLRAIADDSSVHSVNVVTFNYDIWLERTLEALGLNYNVAILSSAASAKISVIKPHGSISFVHKKHLDPSAFSINYASDYLEGKISDFDVLTSDLDRNTPIIAIIPPAGDSDRFNLTWAGHIRSHALTQAKALSDGDKVVLCGLSYWHVDRREIDDLLLNISDKAELAYINPSPPATFDAVLTSLFRQYEHYTSAERYLGGTRYA